MFNDHMMRAIEFEPEDDNRKSTIRQIQRGQEQVNVQTSGQNFSGQQNIGQHTRQSMQPRQHSASSQGREMQSGAQSGNFSSGQKSNIISCSPKRTQDVAIIIDHLKNNQVVFVRLNEVVHVPEVQRILDFISGAAYALGGSVERADVNFYIVTPSGTRIVER
ncbi:MAG: cell division protein SepF [Firmicutes bacterium]|nr:cell division protein SepF [Bacillota bacterium]